MATKKKPKTAKTQTQKPAPPIDESFLDVTNEDPADDSGIQTNFGGPDAGEVEDGGEGKDVFNDSYKNSPKDLPRYWIYRNNALIHVQNYPYSWELLQKKFGPGHYLVKARGSVTGKYIMQQTELIGDPNGDVDGQEEEAPVETVSQNGQLDPLALITIMSQQQERAEAKVNSQAQAASAANTNMIQFMMQMQMESTKQTQLIMQEQQRQRSEEQSKERERQQKADDRYMTLLTTLLTTKKSDDGFTAANVMKMMSDAAKDAKSETKEWYRMVEDKAEKLAEEKAELLSAGNSPEEESLGKTLLKGFLPMMTQMMNNPAMQSQLSGQGEQQAPPPQVPAPGTIPAGTGPNYTPEQLAVIRSRHSGGGKPAEPKVREVTPQVVASGGSAGATVSQSGGAVANPTAIPSARIIKPAVSKGAVSMNGNAESVRLAIFDFVKMDIATALTSRGDASKCAASCLKKLEKQGISPQTVNEVFSLEDLYRYASLNGVPDIAKPWLKDFHATLEQSTAINDGKKPRTQPSPTP